MLAGHVRRDVGQVHGSIDGLANLVHAVDGEVHGAHDVASEVYAQHLLDAPTLTQHSWLRALNFSFSQYTGPLSS